MSSLNNINQYQYVIRLCGSVVVSYAWGRGIEHSSSLIFLSFNAAITWLFYITQRITLPVFCIFRTSLTIHRCTALLQVALVLTPLHKFVSPPCWYYRLEEIIKHDFRVVRNCITSIPNFIQIRPAVLELNHADRKADGRTDRQTWLALYAFI
jgi:hypothetical protein